MPEKNKQVKIMLLIAFFTIVVALFFVFDLQKYLTLEYLKSSKAFFISSYENNPILVLGSYFLFYIVITAFSLPGAVWMTLGGGAFFGLFAGTVIVSFASSIGATLAMLISRFLLRDWVQSRFEKQMQIINAGINKDGGFYLFTLRLGAGGSIFCNKFGNRLDSITCRHFLLGQSTWNASGNTSLYKCRFGTWKNTFLG